MQTQINIQDYTFDSITPSHGWAKVELFGKSVEFNFTRYDAVTAGIELGHIQEPDDRDQKQIRYNHPAFSATVREAAEYGSIMFDVDNLEALREVGHTGYGLEIVTRLALQNEDIKEIIQAEATAICCCDCPANKVGELELKVWWSANYNIPLDCINWEHVSQHKKLSIRTENKLVEKLL